MKIHNMKNTLMYCHKNELKNKEGIFHNNFYKHPRSVEMCGAKKEDIIRVNVRELKTGEVSPYWGWWDNEDNEFGLVFPHRILLEVCFTYGTKVEEDRNRGKVINVFVEEIITKESSINPILIQPEKPPRYFPFT